MERNLQFSKDLLSFLVKSTSRFGHIHEIRAAFPESISSDSIRYHLDLLLDAGFVSGDENKLRVTWQGHDYLDTSASAKTNFKRR